MSRVKIENNQLIVTVQGARKLFAVKSEISIPLTNVQSVTLGLKWKDLPKAWEKIVGTNANSFYLGGSFHQEGNKVFYDIKRKEEAVVIMLNDAEFDTLIIGVEDPQATVDLIVQALS